MNAPVKVHLTQEGYDELSQELDTLKAKHPKAIDRVARAREMGDLSENSEYHVAREDLAFINGRIEEIEEILNRAVVIDESKKNGVADLGSKVTITTKGKEMTYVLVGEYEADPTKKKISVESPLGKALRGAKPDDTVEYEAPVGKIIYTVKKVH